MLEKNKIGSDRIVLNGVTVYTLYSIHTHTHGNIAYGQMFQFRKVQSCYLFTYIEYIIIYA